MKKKVSKNRDRISRNRNGRCRPLLVGLCFAVSVTVLTRFEFVAAQVPPSDSFGGLTWLNVSGEIVAPEKVSFEKFEIKGYGRTGDGRSGSTRIQVHEDGTLTGDAWGGYDYAYFFHDPDLQWAAKPVFLSVGKESPKEKIVLSLEKGSLVEATLLNRETGEPISGMTVWFSQEVEWKDCPAPMKTFRNSFLLRTDENGQIKRYVTPGDFSLTVDMPAHSWGDGERLYSVDFTVKAGADAKPVLKIPPPFVGQVLDENGEPLARARVAIHAPSSDFLYTETDKDGFFKRRAAPKNSLVQIRANRGRILLSYVAWIKDELKNDEVWKVRLKECEAVTGRLIDATTGKPLEKVLLFYEYENPENPKQKGFLPGSTITDAEGYFKIAGLSSNLNYRFFYIPGRTRAYNGGPYSPRVDLAFLKTDKPGETVDLGDLKVDPSLAQADAEEDLMVAFKQLLGTGFAQILSGEKKAGLIVMMQSEDDQTAKRILECRNEPPLDSFAVFPVLHREVPERYWQSFQKDDQQRPLLIALGDLEKERPATPVYLTQLRGETDSPWNVPQDDPSNDGDWKKSPGMLNPKILDNFLNDYLEKVTKNK